METSNMTLVAAVLVVGLMVGAGVGYYMAPAEIIVEKTQAPTYTQPQNENQLIQNGDGSMIAYGALILSILSLVLSVYFSVVKR